MPIEQTPYIQDEELFAILINPNQEMQRLANELNENYEYWSTVKYKPLPSGFTAKDMWIYIKAARRRAFIPVWQDLGLSFGLTSKMQKQCHELDMNFGGSWGSEHISSDENKDYYLLSSLMEEAISSSQMEGASTTRKVAKDMLLKQSKPQNKHQQMIANNYQTICFIVEHKHQRLTPELLCSIHRLMTEDTLENNEDAGRLRHNNEVVVENAITHEVVHIPPDYKALPEQIHKLCAFFNDEMQSDSFIHPIIKAIIIHFLISYLHPFVDGNGRTARALFYWYMIKSGYWLMEYLSVSRLIAKSKKQYEKAFLYTEADDLDMGYFISYHLRVLVDAFEQLKLYIKRKNEEKQSAQSYLRIEGINARQAQIIALYNEDPKLLLTIKDLENRFGVTPKTAKADIIGLVEQGLVQELQVNKVKRAYVRSKDFTELIRQTQI